MIPFSSVMAKMEMMEQTALMELTVVPPQQ